MDKFTITTILLPPGSRISDLLQDGCTCCSSQFHVWVSSLFYPELLFSHWFLLFLSINLSIIFTHMYMYSPGSTLCVKTLVFRMRSSKAATIDSRFLSIWKMKKTFVRKLWIKWTQFKYFRLEEGFPTDLRQRSACSWSGWKLSEPKF